jgi:hypothetical protein
MSAGQSIDIPMLPVCIVHPGQYSIQLYHKRVCHERFENNNTVAADA